MRPICSSVACGSITVIVVAAHQRLREQLARDQRHQCTSPSKTVGITGSPRDICCAAGRQLGAGRGVPFARGLERLAADHLALPDQLDEQLAVVPVVLGRGADADHLGLGHPVGVAPPQRVLAAPDRDLVDALLRHRLQDAVVVLASDELVDEAGGRVAAPGDQLGPHAVAVDGRRRERVDRVLVEVAGDDDPGVARTEPRRAARRTCTASRPRSPESMRTAPSSGPATSMPTRTASAMS